MNQTGKITSQHLDRQAIVYVRQSTAGQVEHHRESTDRQYALARCAERLGWPSARILVIDEDLGLTGASAGHRSGFARLTAEVAIGPGWPCARAGGFQVGAKQRRLVPSA
jgi:hypothetical protein